MKNDRPKDARAHEEASYQYVIVFDVIANDRDHSAIRWYQSRTNRDIHSIWRDRIRSNCSVIKCDFMCALFKKKPNLEFRNKIYFFRYCNCIIVLVKLICSKWVTRTANSRITQYYFYFNFILICNLSPSEPAERTKIKVKEETRVSFSYIRPKAREALRCALLRQHLLIVSFVDGGS